MRHLSIVRALALVGVTFTTGAPAATAAAPGLAGDEVTIQIAARGRALTRADLIMITVPVKSTGQTSAAARTANIAAVERLKAALTAIGIDPRNIVQVAPRNRFGFVGNAPYDPVVDAADFTESAPTKSPKADLKSAETVIEVRLTDPANVPEVSDVLDRLDLAMTGTPSLSLSDDGKAKAIAISDAIGRARKDADIHAAALGLKVVRIGRIDNFCPAETISATWTVFQAALSSAEIGVEPNIVVTDAQVCMDLVAAPK